MREYLTLIVIGIFILLLTISYRNSQINEKFNEAQNLKKELSALQKENEQLEVNIENSLNLNNFLNQVNNPYLLQVGKIIVEMEFSENSNISPIECIDEALIKECNNKKIVNV